MHHSKAVEAAAKCSGAGVIKDPSVTCPHRASSQQIRHCNISNDNSDGRWARGVSEKCRREVN